MKRPRPDTQPDLLRCGVGILWTALVLWMTAASAAGQGAACPESPPDLKVRCSSAAAEAERLAGEVEALEKIMLDPQAVLVKVDRLPGEDTTDFRARVERAAGIRSPVSNTWLPILGRYYLTDPDMALVAMNRRDYWRYIGEALGFESEAARSVFTDQERLGSTIRRTRFLGPQGRIPLMRAERDRWRAFLDGCCPTGTGESLPSLPPSPASRLP